MTGIFSLLKTIFLPMIFPGKTHESFMLINLNQWFLSFFSTLDYTAIIILMAVESSIIPFPSEIVMPPAGYLASQGQLNIFLVILAGVLGSLLGALFNYFLAITLGRSLLYSLAESRWGKLLLLSPKKLQASENFFNQYGRSATLVGRLVPAVRQLISLPAGLARMPLKDFVIFTALGSTIWLTILTILGYAFGANQKIILDYYKYFKEAIWLLFIILALSGFIYFLIKKKHKKL